MTPRLSSEAKQRNGEKFNFPKESYFRLVQEASLCGQSIHGSWC
jgi:hypothetical protein